MSAKTDATYTMDGGTIAVNAKFCGDKAKALQHADDDYCRASLMMLRMMKTIFDLQRRNVVTP